MAARAIVSCVWVRLWAVDEMARVLVSPPPPLAATWHQALPLPFCDNMPTASSADGGTIGGSLAAMRAYDTTKVTVAEKGFEFTVTPVEAKSLSTTTGKYVRGHMPRSVMLEDFDLDVGWRLTGLSLGMVDVLGHVFAQNFKRATMGCGVLPAKGGKPYVTAAGKLPCPWQASLLVLTDVSVAEAPAVEGTPGVKGISKWAARARAEAEILLAEGFPVQWLEVPLYTSAAPASSCGFITSVCVCVCMTASKPRCDSSVRTYSPLARLRPLHHLVQQWSCSWVHPRYIMMLCVSVQCAGSHNSRPCTCWRSTSWVHCVPRLSSGLHMWLTFSSKATLSPEAVCLRTAPADNPPTHPPNTLQHPPPPHWAVGHAVTWLNLRGASVQCAVLLPLRPPDHAAL